jgi:uroporphyrinogen-III synthase
VATYRTVPVVPDEAHRALVADADVVTFTSASTVDQWVAAFGIDPAPAVVACIGPITAAAARSHGLVVDIEAEVHTIDGLVGALVTHLGRAPGKGDEGGGGRPGTPA